MFDLHNDARVLFGASAAVFLALSMTVAVGPALWSQQNNQPLPASQPLSDLEQRGLEVYISEGCVACHTQQVRPLEMDEPYGRAAVPADFARLKPLNIFVQTPALLGSERTGPDLSNVGARQSSDVWHYIHLYNPRAVVADSVMPAHRWLFKEVDAPTPAQTLVRLPPEFAPANGKAVVTTPDAEALVAYLLSLKQPKLPDHLATAAKKSAPAKGAATGAGGDAKKGASLYSANCAACHQENGQGMPGVFPPLVDDPVVTDEDPTEHIRIVLEGLQGREINGVSYASPMTAFADVLNDDEIAAVINHERTSWGNSAPTITAEDVAKIRQAIAK